MLLYCFSAFVSDMLGIVGSCWIPTLEKRMNEEYNEKEKQFQQVRRGRYIEFNLVRQNRRLVL